ncbi:RloB family protein [Streptomyces aurantiacus]|uniref:RloB family protein n=1 Tax=Streptomyces aurantiacus TaxID=47760 RepID=UPI001BD53B31|nr:RloB family protein [Streptomyces aurantiacus]
MARTPKPSGWRSPQGPSHETDLGRRTDTRDSLDRLLVVCGAETTERDYLKGFKAAFKRRTLSVRVTERPGSPSQVVRYAADRWGGSGGEFDQVWCVVDVDEFEDLDRAQRLARRENIELAVSNPCFELWLLLHHTDHRSWVADYRTLKPLLQKHAEVRTDKSVDFPRYYGGDRWEHAVARARDLAPEHTSTRPIRPLACGAWR